MASTESAPPFGQQITFLNTSDLEAATAFYRDVVGLPVAYSAPGYVNFFQSTPSAFIAVCLREPGSREPGDASGAIPTFVVSTEAEVDVWNDKLTKAGVEVTKAAGPGVSSDGKEIAAIYNCMCRDPSGYLVEFQMFRDPHWPQPQSL